MRLFRHIFHKPAIKRRKGDQLVLNSTDHTKWFRLGEIDYLRQSDPNFQKVNSFPDDFCKRYYQFGWDSAELRFKYPDQSLFQLRGKDF